MIKKRNLDPSLVQWIMSVSNLGPGIGELKYVAPATSSTSQYRTQLESMGVSSGDIFTLPSGAEAALEAYRNDIMFVAPGAYDEESEIAWDKQATHIIGMGGPNTHGDHSEPNCAIYTDTTTVGAVVNVTGRNCQVINMTFVNAGNHATNLAGLTANGYGGFYQNCSFQGNMTANQLSAVAAASLNVGGAGMFNQFHNCQVGNDQWGKRSGANSGQIRFTGTVQPNGIIFKDCRIVSWSQTASCAAVALPANGAVGRGLTFDDCLFYNLYDPAWAYMENVFYDNDMAGQTITLKDCAAYGYQEWQANGAGVDRRIWSNMGLATVGGGLPIEPTATIS